jgi:hypothetical protein
MIRPHPNQTDTDARSRAAALRAARYCCSWCERPKATPGAIEVYADDAGEIVLCYKCRIAFELIQTFYPITSRWQGWNR